MIKGLIISVLFTTTLFANNCEYHFLWGHGDKIQPNALKLKDEGACYIGEGCFLENNSGNIPGHLPSDSSNGHWMHAEYFEAIKMTPEQYAKSLDNFISLKKATRIIKDIKNAYTPSLFNGGLNPVIAEDVKQSFSVRQNKEHDSVGFIKMTEHNWMIMLLKVMRDNLPQSECSKVKIHFSCIHNGNEQYVWDKRIEYATTTQLKDINGNEIRYTKKQCAHNINSVPETCNSTYELTIPQLLDVYENCTEILYKYSLLDTHYSLLSKEMSLELNSVNSDTRGSGQSTGDKEKHENSKSSTQR